MKRLWLTTSFLICGLVQAAVGWNAVYAEDDVSGAKLLPKDTLLFATVPSVSDSKELFQKSLTGSMLNDKELKPFLDDVKAKIDELSEQVEGQIGVSLMDILDIPEGEITFAVTQTESQKLSLVFLFDYGDNGETVEKLLKKLHDALEGPAEHSTEDVDDVKIHVYAFKDSPAENPFKTLAYFSDESYLVFSSEVSTLKEILERWDGDSDDTLANNEVYKYIQERCKDESEATGLWYMSPIGLIQAGLTFAQQIAPQAGMANAVLPIIGIDRLKGYGGAMYATTGDFDGVSKSFLYMDQSAGLLNVFQFPATELTPPKWVGADVTTYMSMNWNLPKAYQAIETLVDSFQGRGALSRLMDQLADSDGGPGIHPKKDIIDQLDGKIHVIQGVDVKEGSTPSQQVLMAFELKDPAKIKKTLSKAAKSAGSSVETREFNGETIYEMTNDDTNQTLLFTVAASQFVFSNDAPTIERMLRSEKQPPLSESAAYRSVAKHFPSKTSMIAFQRSDAQLQAAYEMLKNADVDFLDGIDLKKLPPFEVLQKYLRPSGFYTIPDKKGAFSVTFQLRDSDK